MYLCLNMSVLLLISALMTWSIAIEKPVIPSSEATSRLSGYSRRRKWVGEVSLVTGYCANWIRQVARRYNREGAQGLGDQRHHNPGATPFLSLDQQKRLRDKLEQAAPDGGLWTGQKVARLHE